MCLFFSFLTEPRASVLIVPETCGSKPVYGLIFLFRWKEDDADKQEQSCPDGLWFANQVKLNSIHAEKTSSTKFYADCEQCMCQCSFVEYCQ